MYAHKLLCYTIASLSTEFAKHIMVNQEPKVYISILNWRGCEKTLHCLESLKTLDYRNYQVVIVDNGSADDSVECIRSQYPDSLLICSESNVGYAAGNALALDYALKDPEAELFWILNNDAVVREDTLSELVKAYLEHGDAIYGAVPLQSDSQQNQWNIMMQFWEYNRAQQRYRHHKIYHQSYEQYFAQRPNVDQINVSGSCMLIPLHVVKQFGFIDLDYFLYMEDTDYCFRMRAKGVNSFLVPSAVIFHVGGGSRQGQKLKPVILYYQTRNRIIFRRKYIGWFSYATMILRQLSAAFVWLLYIPSKGRSAWLSAYYTLMGIGDALINRMGKRISPEDHLKEILA